MTPERIVELETVGFIWEVRKTWGDSSVSTKVPEMGKSFAAPNDSAKTREGEHTEAVVAPNASTTSPGSGL